MLITNGKEAVPSISVKRPFIGSLLSCSCFAILVVGAIPRSQSQSPAEKAGPGLKTAIAARDILVKNCSSSSCHGASFIFDPNSRASIIQRVVKPGDLDGSLLLAKISSREMPPDPSPKLSAADLQTLKDWVRDGAPDWNAYGTGANRPAANLSEPELLKEILADLQSQPEDKRPFIRYFSTANLLRNPDTAETIQKAEIALAKLVNSLSWSSEIVKLAPFGSGKALYRLDIREVDWTPKTWNEILSFYPYGFVPSHERGAMDQIRTLSGAAVPYIRADWFISTASVPPLYHDILHLPDHVSGKGGLEEMLGVDALKDQQEDKVVRAGLENSGVSHNNRAIERHRGQFGFYYKSFDFASNEGRKNIFQFPMDFQEDGGEFIWRLPNGMQGYMIAKANGERLDVAPANIVRDRLSTFDDVRVINGLSCISCHANGMQFLQSDEVRQNLDTLSRADYDLDHAKLWYVTSQELRRVQLDDAQRFEEALIRVGGSLPHVGGEPALDPKNEPCTQVAVLYRSSAVSIATAAAECGLSVDEFQEKIKRSTRLTELGLPGLLGHPNGSVKRDIWEQDFGHVISELGLGEFIQPTEHPSRPTVIDPRVSVRIETSGHSALTARLKSQLFLALSSDVLKPVTQGGDKVVTVSASEDGTQVVLKARIEGKPFEITGDLENFAGLAANLADDVHRTFTGLVVPSAGSTTASSSSFTKVAATHANPTISGPDVSASAPTSTAQLLDLALRTGTIGTAISVDRGQGSTFKMGQEITIRYSASQDCFAAIYDVDSAGKVTLLFPNKVSHENRLEAGRTYSTASPSRWGLNARDTPGREHLFLLCAPSNDQLPGVNAFLQDPTREFVSKSVGAFARTVQSDTQGTSAGAIGASVVEFFTAN